METLLEKGFTDMPWRREFTTSIPLLPFTLYLTISSFSIVSAHKNEKKRSSFEKLKENGSTVCFKITMGLKVKAARTCFEV